MSMSVTLDSAGRVLLPKTVRDQLHLQAGDTLALEHQDDQVILKAVRPAAPLRKEHGVWVFRGTRKLSADTTGKVLQEQREERDRVHRFRRP